MANVNIPEGRPFQSTWPLAPDVTKPTEVCVAPCESVYFNRMEMSLGVSVAVAVTTPDPGLSKLVKVIVPQGLVILGEFGEFGPAPSLGQLTPSPLIARATTNKYGANRRMASPPAERPKRPREVTELMRSVSINIV
jgi:hypothetical protein